MTQLHELEPDRTVHPVDIIEHIAAINDWSFERQDADEISISVRGSWSDYHVSFNWMEDLESLHIAAASGSEAADRADQRAVVDRPLRHVEPRGRDPLPQLASAERWRRRDAAAVRGAAELGDRELRPLLPGIPVRGVGGQDRKAGARERAVRDRGRSLSHSCLSTH